MSNIAPLQPIHILLVEDSEGDIRLVKEALKTNKLHNHLSICMDGEEASDFLYRRGQYADVNRPDLILLDLDLPKKNGKELLNEIKADKDLKRIPVVVLTSSDADTDIANSYDLHANCYITKPVVFEKLAEVVKAIDFFWLSIVRLPRY